jgi:hypothetical protein
MLSRTCCNRNAGLSIMNPPFSALQVQAKRAAMESSEAPEEIGGSGRSKKKARLDFGGLDVDDEEEDPFYAETARAAHSKKSARKDR